MRILGIDPGTTVMGFGVLRYQGISQAELVDLGCVQFKDCKTHYEKLRKVFDIICTLIERYQPDELAIESPFFGKNVQSMLKLGRAQGVAIAAVLSATPDTPIAEYAPTRIKQAITGRGQASKEQVATMINSILGTDYHPRKLDATDGMAVALCHWFTTSNVLTQATSGERRKGLGGDSKSRKGSSSWESFVKSNPERVKK